ncbi:Interleukin-23 subunit alpha, partial [Dissostichus eleginoides]
MMKMMLCFSAVLWLLVAAARGSPIGLSVHEEPCLAVRNSSLQLNQLARTAAREARNGSNNIDDFTSDLAWIETKDLCDPESLKHNPKTCLEKLLHVSSSYRSAVKRVSEFEKCSKFASKLQPAMLKLQRDMRRCQPSDWLEAVGRWEEASLCRFTLDRLFSFSILTARVFAVGIRVFTPPPPPITDPRSLQSFLVTVMVQHSGRDSMQNRKVSRSKEEEEAAVSEEEGTGLLNEE